MINYKPISREGTPDTFQFNAGIDSINDPAFLGKGKVTNMVNMDFNDYGPVARAGLTIHGDSANSIVNGQGAILKESGDIHVRVLGTKFQKLVTGTWIDIATVTSIAACIISFQSADLTTASVLSGTATTDSTSQMLVVSAGAMTINAYAGKIVRITSGTGAGQENLISGNDLTSIFVSSSWETIPDGTSVFEIREVAPHVIVTNGTDTPFKYDGTTKTDLTLWKKFHVIDVAHDRIFGIRNDLDYVYISNLGTDYFPKDNYIPVNQSGDVISAVQKNHEEVVVYKNNSRYRITGSDIDSFSLFTADEKIGCIAPKSVVHGNNYNFFLGFGGVYSINSLDNSMVDEGIPISLDITNLILAHSAVELEAAVGWINDNKYHLAIGNEVFVYHIAQSQIMKTHVWTRYSYPDNIKSAYVKDGEVYLGGVQSYQVGGNTDYGNIIYCTVETGDRAQKDRDRNKIYHRDIINFKKTNTSIDLYIAINGGTLVLNGTYSALNGKMTVMVNKRGMTIRYRYLFAGTNSPEMQTHSIFFTPLPKTP